MARSRARHAAPPPKVSGSPTQPPVSPVVARVARARATGDELNGEDFHRALAAGASWLERNAAAINALNVFPVPDGDTGTNMLLTVRAAVEAASRVKGVEARHAAHVMRAAAQGAVMGARGNSGVILSQVIAGIARGLGEAASCDGALLARGLEEGADTAYRAVTKPVEGTILTVARAAADAARAAVADGSATCRVVLETAAAAARTAVERTPNQLAILRQAGVVDAGGEGYRVILEGMALGERGEALPNAPDTPEVQFEALDALGHPPQVGADLLAVPTEEWGYCTQFVIRGQGLDVERMRAELQTLAESALVVGDETLIRVHGHTEDPGQLLSYGARLGRLQRISIEDMDAQHDAWLRTQVEETGAAAATAGGLAIATHGPEPAVAVATVAVAPGEGLADVFRSLGTAEVVAGGQTMNPSARELLDAAQRTGARRVLILPNNANVIMTARQAAGVSQESGQQLIVVPTRTVPQGIAAQLAFSSDLDAKENAAAMEDAAGAVRTVEVTRATRSVTLDEIAVREGDLLGLVDDKLVVAASTVQAAAVRALDAAGAPRAELITAYYGQGVDASSAQQLGAALRTRFPKAEIEVVAGGQPHYDFIISVE